MLNNQLVILIISFYLISVSLGGVKHGRTKLRNQKRVRERFYYSWTPVTDEVLVTEETLIEPLESDNTEIVEPKEIEPSGHGNSHAYHHQHDAHHSPLYEKYNGMRPLDLKKILPMAALVGMYALLPAAFQVI